MRVGGRARDAWRQRLVRRTAVVLAVVLAVSVAAPSQSLVGPGQDPLPLSWLWSWWEFPAGWATPPTPAQASAGTAAGKSHQASTASTQAGRGAGHAPGKGSGQLDPYAPHQVPTSAVTTAPIAGDGSFDPARSRRIAAGRDSDVGHLPESGR
ncbi:MAG TPA: hypothetical protein VEO01_14000 [Pseudonocardiaceae bacterium]|nr:hypothetical protein [Pseudonocardiaceae bacterium]